MPPCTRTSIGPRSSLTGEFGFQQHTTNNLVTPSLTPLTPAPPTDLILKARKRFSHRYQRRRPPGPGLLGGGVCHRRPVQRRQQAPNPQRAPARPRQQRPATSQRRQRLQRYDPAHLGAGELRPCPESASTAAIVLEPSGAQLCRQLGHDPGKHQQPHRFRRPPAAALARRPAFTAHPRLHPRRQLRFREPRRHARA